MDITLDELDFLSFISAVEKKMEEENYQPADERESEEEEEEEDGRVDREKFNPGTGIVRTNALKYTKEYRDSRLTLPKKAFELHTRFTYGKCDNYTHRELQRCVNSGCLGTSDQFQTCPHDGTYVCTLCGAVQLSQVIQELEPFLWHYNPAHRSEIPGYLVRDNLNSYQPKFHWNEDEKLRRLVAPPIPRFNREVIFWKLQEMGYSRSDRINNPKLVVQEACRLIDNENDIHVYGRKWGEHWMTIVSLYTQGRQRPPTQPEEDRSMFASKFDWFYYAWPMCSHLLPGSRKDRVRWQLPQFRWIYRQLLITFTPCEFEKWAEWLPVLSKCKEVELDLFWKRMCFINGWEYRYPEPFIKMIKEKNKKKRMRRKPKKSFHTPSPSSSSSFVEEISTN